MTELAQGPDTATDLIEVVVHERSVSLLVRPPADGQSPATWEDAVAALRRGPFSSVPQPKLASVVAAQSGKPVPVGQVPLPPDAEGWFVVVSSDSLAAYLVPAPTPSPAAEGGSEPPQPPVEVGGPEVGGPEVEPAPIPISSAEIVERLPEFEVTHGVLADVLASFDPPRLLETIECIAVGEPAVEGRDGTIELGLDDEGRHPPALRKDGTVDHHATLASRFVETGAVIAMRVPPVAGTAGIDVRGQSIEPAAVADLQLDGLVGLNTELQGELLVATNPGRPVRNGDRVDILPSYDVPGDLNYAVGNIEFAGDVLVKGDVKPGFSIVATGSVVIGGMVEHASIHAGGNISLQGVVGDHDGDARDESDGSAASLEAGGDIDAQYLHTVSVRAGGELRVNREIVNCSVYGARVLTGPSGRIVGGEVVAEMEIAAGSLGSHTGSRTQLQITTHRSEEPLVVRAWQAAYAGVRLNVSSAILDLEDDLPAASFWQLEGEVVRLDSLASLTDVIAFAEETGRRPPRAPSDGPDGDGTEETPTDEADEDTAA